MQLRLVNTKDPQLLCDAPNAMGAIDRLQPLNIPTSRASWVLNEPEVGQVMLGESPIQPHCE